MEEENRVVLSLGGNLGDRVAFLRDAIQLLEIEFNTSLIVSSFYETVPWGFESEDLFLNCCAYFSTSKSPQEVLQITKKVEKELGRVKKSQNNRYNSRVIDIDILYHGERIVQDENLRVPHPLLYDRSFVLVPLAEILPDFVDPVEQLSIIELKAFLNDIKDVVLYLHL